MHALAQAFPEDGIAVMEAPSSTLALRNQLRISRPGSYYFGAGGGLGFGLAAAVGVQLAQPDRPVVCVVGEGSAQYAITALWSAIAYEAPLTVLVLRNSEYAILKWFAGLEEVEGAPGLDLPSLSCLKVAEGYGMKAREVTTATTSWSRRCATRSAPPSRGWSRSRSRPACGCSRNQPHGRRAGLPTTAASVDRAPDWVAGGTPAPLRSDLVGLLGDDAVLARATDLIRYASDASPYRLIPKAVVQPRDPEGVARVLAYGREHEIPVTFRAGGTSLNGQGQGDGILVDVRRHWRGVEVLDDGGAGPGEARDRPRSCEPHPRRLRPQAGPRPGVDRHRDCAGGVIANNSGGMRCGTWATPTPTVTEMTFLTAAGTTINTAEPGAPERFAHAEPELARGLAEIRDEVRADAELAERIRAQVRDQEHHRLPPLRLSRRRRATRDLSPPHRRLGGNARADLRGGLRDRAGAGSHDPPPGSTSPASTRRASRCRGWSSWARARSS